MKKKCGAEFMKGQEPLSECHQQVFCSTNYKFRFLFVLELKKIKGYKAYIHKRKSV